MALTRLRNPMIQAQGNWAWGWTVGSVYGNRVRLTMILQEHKSLGAAM